MMMFCQSCSRKFKRNLKSNLEKARSLKILLKVESQKATYSTANNFAIEVGEILARALQSVVTADRLPDGKMYYNIAKRLLEPVLGNNYKTVADYVVKVQSDLNKKAKIGLNAKSLS